MVCKLYLNKAVIEKKEKEEISEMQECWIRYGQTCDRAKETSV